VLKQIERTIGRPVPPGWVALYLTMILAFAGFALHELSQTIHSIIELLRLFFWLAVFLDLVLRRHVRRLRAIEL